MTAAAVQFDLFSEPPKARRSDPVTSHLAASAAKELQAKHHRVILQVLTEYGPLGKDGIASRSRLDGVAVCRRLSELERMRKIEKTGRMVNSTAGRLEREWRVVA
jgi:hypothetical protein